MSRKPGPKNLLRRSPRVSVSLSHETYAALVTRAQRSRCPVSFLAARALQVQLATWARTDPQETLVRDAVDPVFLPESVEPA